MKNIDKFSILPIEKETIKIRIIFTIEYFKDKVFLGEDYFDQVLNEYKQEKVKENEIQEAWDTTLLTTQLLEIQYRMILMYISLICQMFEQFVINQIIEKLELNKGIYFLKAKDKFKLYGFEFEILDSWKKIEELRLLVNVIKHGDGDSKNKLQEIRKDLFYSEKNEMLRNSINDMTLNITAKDFFEYCKSIIEFIEQMPTTYEKKEN